jgi:hypothetical protein
MRQQKTYEGDWNKILSLIVREMERLAPFGVHIPTLMIHQSVAQPCTPAYSHPKMVGESQLESSLVMKLIWEQL